MKVLIPPAKSFKRESNLELSLSTPVHINKSLDIISNLCFLNIDEISRVLNVSDNIAAKSAIYYQNFDYEKGEKYPSILSYDGQLYKSLNALCFNNEELLYANNTVRILSAFYGVLRPLDNILPYRLELNCKFKINGKNLYKYWGNSYYKAIFEESGEEILSLLSKEYESAIIPYIKPSDNFYRCNFLCLNKGKFKPVAIFAKRGRGAMAKFIVQERIEKVEQIKNFNLEGFSYSKHMSNDREYTFIMEY